MKKIDLHNCSIGEMWCRDILLLQHGNIKGQDILFDERYAPNFTLSSMIALIILSIVMIYPIIVYFVILKLGLSCVFSFIFSEQIVKKLSFNERKIRFELYRAQFDMFCHNGKDYYKVVDTKTNLEWIKKKPLENRPKWLSYVLTIGFFLLFSIF